MGLTDRLLVILSIAAVSFGRVITTPSSSLDSEQSTTNTSIAPLKGADVFGGPLDFVNHGSDTEPSLVQVAGSYDPNDIADAETLTYYGNKGNTFNCYLKLTDAQAGQAWLGKPSAASAWKGTLQEELKDWFWHEASFDQNFNCHFGDDGDHAHRIGTALAALGLSEKPKDQGGDNMCYSIEHMDEDLVDEHGPVPLIDQLYTVDGDPYQYRATGAYYRFAINHAGGAIFAQDLLNTMTAGEQFWGFEPDPSELPKLRPGSDIISAYWLRGNSSPKNLRYYFVNHVVNDQTLPVIAALLHGQPQGRVPYWPGVTFDMSTEQGQAMLGSPIGATLGFLLLQHKAELGIKQVSSVTIFRDNHPVDTLAEIQLLFKMEAYVPPDDEVGETSEYGLEARSAPRNNIRVHEMMYKDGEMEIRSGPMGL